MKRNKQNTHKRWRQTYLLVAIKRTNWSGIKKVINAPLGLITVTGSNYVYRFSPYCQPSAIWMLGGSVHIVFKPASQPTNQPTNHRHHHKSQEIMILSSTSSLFSDVPFVLSSTSSSHLFFSAFRRCRRRLLLLRQSFSYFPFTLGWCRYYMVLYSVADHNWQSLWWHFSMITEAFILRIGFPLDLQTQSADAIIVPLACSPLFRLRTVVRGKE